jgi:hypothetical protein
MPEQPEEELAFRDPVDEAGFAILYHCMTRDAALSDGAYRTYALLLLHARQSGRCWPGQERLARERGCNDRTIRRHLDELQHVGLLTIERRGDKKTNRYILESVHLAYRERQDKNVRSTDRTKMSDRDRSEMSAPGTGQNCPPKKKQQKNKQSEEETAATERLARPCRVPAAAVTSAAVALPASPSDPNQPTPTGSMANAPVVLELIEAGMNRADALRLAVASPEECRRQLDYLPFVTEFRSGPGAYLRTAIEQGWAPPQAWREAEEKRRKEAAASARREQQAAQVGKASAAEEARTAALCAEKERLQREEPQRWAALVAEAEASLPPPIKARPDGPAYRPALEAKIDALIRAADVAVAA